MYTIIAELQFFNSNKKYKTPSFHKVNVHASNIFLNSIHNKHRDESGVWRLTHIVVSMSGDFVLARVNKIIEENSKEYKKIKLGNDLDAVPLMYMKTLHHTQTLADAEVKFGSDGFENTITFIEYIDTKLEECLKSKKSKLIINDSVKIPYYNRVIREIKEKVLGLKLSFDRVKSDGVDLVHMYVVLEGVNEETGEVCYYNFMAFNVASFPYSIKDIACCTLDTGRTVTNRGKTHQKYTRLITYDDNRKPTEQHYGTIFYTENLDNSDTIVIGRLMHCDDVSYGFGYKYVPRKIYKINEIIYNRDILSYGSPAYEVCNKNKCNELYLSRYNRLESKIELFKKLIPELNGGEVPIEIKVSESCNTPNLTFTNYSIIPEEYVNYVNAGVIEVETPNKVIKYNIVMKGTKYAIVDLQAINNNFVEVYVELPMISDIEMNNVICISINGELKICRVKDVVTIDTTQQPEYHCSGIDFVAKVCGKGKLITSILNGDIYSVQTIYDTRNKQHDILIDNHQAILKQILKTGSNIKVALSEYRGAPYNVYELEVRRNNLDGTDDYNEYVSHNSLQLTTLNELIDIIFNLPTKINGRDTSKNKNLFEWDKY